MGEANQTSNQTTKHNTQTKQKTTRSTGREESNRDSMLDRNTMQETRRVKREVTIRGIGEPNEVVADHQQTSEYPEFWTPCRNTAYIFPKEQNEVCFWEFVEQAKKLFQGIVFFMKSLWFQYEMYYDQIYASINFI